MRSIAKRRPSPAMVVALAALMVALGGTASALPGKNKVLSDDIKNGQVRTGDIKDNEVLGKDIRNGTVADGDVRPDGLTGASVNESTLDRVPSAATAESATNATNATNAANATNADTLDGRDSTDLAPRAFALVEANGTVVADSSRGITSANVSKGNGTNGSTGIYCFRNLGFDPKVAVASVETGGFGVNDSIISARARPDGFAAAGISLANCTDTEDAQVTIADPKSQDGTDDTYSYTPLDASFVVLFY